VEEPTISKAQINKSIMKHKNLYCF